MVSKPERKYRDRKKQKGGLVMGKRWQDIKKGECQGEESETQQ